MAPVELPPAPQNRSVNVSVTPHPRVIGIDIHEAVVVIAMAEPAVGPGWDMEFAAAV